MLLALVLSIVPASVPDVVTLTAVLEEDGAPLDRAVAASFSLWSAPLGGDSLWSEGDRPLLVEEGVLVVELGAERPLPPRIFGAPAWLELTIDGEVLAPRVRITSAPHAIEASHAREAAHALEATHAASATRADVCTSVDGLGADDLVTHDDLAGRVPLYLVAPGCGRLLSLNDACTTAACSDHSFRSCSGTCEATGPVVCDNSHVGWLLEP